MQVPVPEGEGQWTIRERRWEKKSSTSSKRVISRLRVYRKNPVNWDNFSSYTLSWTLRERESEGRVLYRNMGCISAGWLGQVQPEGRSRTGPGEKAHTRVEVQVPQRSARGRSDRMEEDCKKWWGGGRAVQREQEFTSIRIFFLGNSNKILLASGSGSQSLEAEGRVLSTQSLHTSHISWKCFFKPDIPLIVDNVAWPEREERAGMIWCNKRPTTAKTGT